MSVRSDLVTLDLAFVGPLSQGGFAPSSRILLPCLQHCILTGMEDFATCHFLLSFLRMPDLRRLHIIHFNSPPPHVDMLLPPVFSFSPIISTAQQVHISLHWVESMFEVNFMPSGATTESSEDSTFKTIAMRGDELEAICKFRYEGLEPLDSHDQEFTDFICRSFDASARLAPKNLRFATWAEPPIRLSTRRRSSHTLPPCLGLRFAAEVGLLVRASGAFWQF